MLLSLGLLEVEHRVRSDELQRQLLRRQRELAGKRARGSSRPSLISWLAARGPRPDWSRGGVANRKDLAGSQQTGTGR